MLCINKDKLVMMSLSGKVSPSNAHAGFSVDHNGKPFFTPGTGGICYNVLVGDSAFGLAGDHIEPGVSSRGYEEAYKATNNAYNFLACIGNKVRIAAGDAKDKTGVVTGHHGGSERVMIDFEVEDMEKITHDDTFMIKSIGQGLELLDYPDVRVCNIDPELLEKLNIVEEDGKIKVGVTHIIPGKLMGSGVGSTRIGSGDYDIMTQDEDLVKEHNIDTIRFGDIVAISDHDNVYGRSYKTGAMTIGIVIHSDCKFAGHGPGVTTILSSRTPIIEPVIDEKANIAEILEIGRYRKASDPILPV